MGLQYVYSGTEDHIYPRLACDVCHKAILDIADGNVAWEAPPESWTSGDMVVDRVFFTHKACDYLLRTYLRQQGIETYWEELATFPIHLLYNSGMQAAAMAAWEVRRPIATQEPRDRTGLSLRFSILKRDKYRCQLCGRGATDGVVLEIDHKVARANGGTDTPANLWTLCFDCNRGKRADYL